MLLSFKHSEVDFKELFTSFQPSLAECLYKLMTFYQKLHQEEKDIVSMKTSIDADIFPVIMKTNAQFQKIIKTTIEIGKNLGDAFVWFFYIDNREELDKHFEHKATGLYVGGIGGLGELNFIKNKQFIDRYYVVYHGITNILRIGDFTLYDFDKGFVGVGELKTKKENDELKVSASITSKVNIDLPPSQDDEKTFDDWIKDLQKDFPKIKEQIGVHSELMKLKPIDNSSDVSTDYEYDLINLMSEDSPITINKDNSLLLLGTWSKYDSLFERLSNIEETTALPDNFNDKVSTLTKPESIYNEFILGKLNITTTILSIPLLWWDIEDEKCRDLYFYKLEVATIFNPAKLLQKYVDDGFKIIDFGELKKIKIQKEFDGKRIRLERFDAICYLVVNSLMETNKVYESSKLVSDTIQNQGFTQNTKVDLKIHLDNFGKRT